LGIPIGQRHFAVLIAYLAISTDGLTWEKPIVGRYELEGSTQNNLVSYQFGIELNEDEIKRHPFEPELPQQVFHPDGSVGVW